MHMHMLRGRGFGWGPGGVLMIHNYYALGTVNACTCTYLGVVVVAGVVDDS